MVELPAGTFEANEISALDVAIRELLEETGYVSDDWINLGKTIESPSKSNGQITIFWAKNSRCKAEQSLDLTEDIELMIAPLSETVEMCFQNIVKANSSMTGILMMARLIGI